MSVSLGDIFKNRREELGRGNRDFSVRKVASRANISATYLSQLERDQVSTPSEEVIKSLSSVLDLKAIDLILMTGQVSSELGDIIRSRPDEITDLLLKLGNVKRNDLVSAVQEVRAAAYEWVPQVMNGGDVRGGPALEIDIIPPPQNPGPNETGRWGQKMACRILENLGYTVEENTEFPAASNALLVSGKSILLDKRSRFTVLPKTSKSSQQIRLGSKQFVANRQADQFYMAFMPKTRGVSVFRDPEVFLIPAKIARNDGLLANEVYEARGGKSAGIILKDVAREPHRSVMIRWRRCFLYPEALDWLPR